MSAADVERLARAYLMMARPLGDRDVIDSVWQYGPVLAATLVSASWPQDIVAAAAECRTGDLRLVVPGDEEWPAARWADPWLAPLGLWVRGGGHLGQMATRAVGVAGRQDATPYGTRVTAELGRKLAEAGWTVVTLGRTGIDSAALRGALPDVTTDGPRPAATPALVLPFGRLVDPEPAVHEDLYRRVGWTGALLGEHGANVPRRHGRPDALRQVRLLVDLVSAVVMVEPYRRGWDHRLVRTAENAGRPVLAVPGPVGSSQSRFSHELIRTGRARLVTGPGDVLRELERDRG